MRYLITYTDPQLEPFYSEWYDYENNYDPELGMVIFDLINHLYTTNGKDWKGITQNHL